MSTSPGYRPEITIFRLDTARGTLAPAGKATNVGQDPSFLALDPAAKFLFAVNETDPGRVRSFAINQATGALTPVNDVPSMGSITAHLSTDRTGRWLLVANYGDQKQGTIASIPIGADGRLGAAVDTREFGLGSMAHQIRADPGNRFVYVPLKGGPAVAQLVFDPATGRMKPNVPPQVAAAAGAGPRHLDFHPNGRFAYVINELDLTMTAFAYDAKTGLLARAAGSSDAAGRGRQGRRVLCRRPRPSAAADFSTARIAATTASSSTVLATTAG